VLEQGELVEAFLSREEVIELYSLGFRDAF